MKGLEASGGGLSDWGTVGEEDPGLEGSSTDVGDAARRTVSCIGSGVVPRLLGDLEARGSGSKAYTFISLPKQLLSSAGGLGESKVTCGGLLLHSRSNDPSNESEHVSCALLRPREVSNSPFTVWNTASSSCESQRESKGLISDESGLLGSFWSSWSMLHRISRRAAPPRLAASEPMVIAVMMGAPTVGEDVVAWTRLTEWWVTGELCAMQRGTPLDVEWVIGKCNCW